MKCSKCPNTHKEATWFCLIPSGLVCNHCVSGIAKIILGHGNVPLVRIDRTGIHAQAVKADGTNLPKPPTGLSKAVLARVLAEPDNVQVVTWGEGSAETKDHWFDTLTAASKDGQLVLVLPKDKS